MSPISRGELDLSGPIHGDGSTEIWYVGLRGEGTGNRRDMIVTAVYELKPNPSDHKTPAEDGAPAMGL